MAETGIKKKTLIQLAIMLVVIFVLGAIVYKSKAKDKLDKAVAEAPNALLRASAQTLGAPDAKVHIVEFMDPGCETCRAFHPFVKKLLDKHGGKLKLSIRYLPLHDGADVMVKILEASLKQGKYWETLHLMFESQPQWASHHNPQPDKIWPLLPQIGVNVDAARRDMNDPAIAAMLEQDLADARTLGIRKTPSFFVNGEPLRKFGYEQLEALINSAIAKNY